MSEQIASKAERENLRTNEKKWGKALMAAGWNVIPNIIIEKQEALGLDAIDMNIIVHLSHYWWQAENLPRPTVETIAKAIGVTPRTIQKRISALEAIGLLKREQRRHTKQGSAPNLYNFEGLIKAAEPFAIEKLEQIAASKADKAERLRRKRPRIVASNDLGPPSK